MDFYGGADQRAQWFKNAGMADPDAVQAGDPGIGTSVAPPMMTTPTAPPMQGPQGPSQMPQVGGLGRLGRHLGGVQTAPPMGLGGGYQGYQAGLAPAPPPQMPDYAETQRWAPAQFPGGGGQQLSRDQYQQSFQPQPQMQSRVGSGPQRPSYLDPRQIGEFDALPLSEQAKYRAQDYGDWGGVQTTDQGGDEGFHPTPAMVAQAQANYASQPPPPSWSSGQSYGAGRPQSRSMQGGYGEGPQRQQNSSYAMDQQNQYRQQSQGQPQSRQRNSWGGGSWGGGQHNSGGSYGNSGGSGGGFNSMTSEPSSQPQRGWSGGSGGGPRRGSNASAMNEPGGSGGY